MSGMKHYLMTTWIVYLDLNMIDVREERGSCPVFNIDNVLHIINDIYTN